MSSDVKHSFGFIPLAQVVIPIYTHPTDITVHDMHHWAVKAHFFVKASRPLNYRGAYVNVPTELNIIKIGGVFVETTGIRI